LLKLASIESFTYFEKDLDKLVSDETNETFHNLTWLDEHGPQVHRCIYFIIEYFKHYEKLSPIVEKWFIKNGISSSLVNSEAEIIYSAKRLNTTSGFFKRISFDLYKNEKEFYDDVIRSSQYTYGNLLLAESRTLGVLVKF
jgi:hypothetical protein